MLGVGAGRGGDVVGQVALLELRLEATRRAALAALLTDTLRRSSEAAIEFHAQAGLPG